MTFDRWLTIVGIVLSWLLSWIVSRHYYKRSDKKPIPTFVLQSTKVLAAPELSNDGLAVVWQGRELGRNGITEAVVNFWNSGSLPIEQVLAPFTISLPVWQPILHCSVLKTNRAVTGLQLLGPGPVPAPNEVTLLFKVLEPGDGATIRVVYDGPPKTTISFSGACIGAPTPTILPTNPVYFSTRYQRLRGGYQLLVPGFMSVGLLALLMGGGWIVKRIFGEHAASLWGEGFIIFCLIIAAASLITAIVLGIKYLTAPYMPPDVRP